MLGVFFWVAVGLFVCLCCVFGWRGNDAREWVATTNFAACCITAICAVFLGVTWLIGQGERGYSDTTPKGQCVVQQYQDVWEGKTVEHKWECIGWASQ